MALIFAVVLCPVKLSHAQSLLCAQIKQNVSKVLDLDNQIMVNDELVSIP